MIQRIISCFGLGSTSTTVTAASSDGLNIETRESKPARLRAVNMLIRKPLTAARAARIIASITVFVTVVAGVLIHLTDPKNFPSIGDGLWWAIQTVTTVGYGDLVPTSATGRLVASLVMVLGIGFWGEEPSSLQASSWS